MFARYVSVDEVTKNAPICGVAKTRINYVRRTRMCLAYILLWLSRADIVVPWLGIINPRFIISRLFGTWSPWTLPLRLRDEKCKELQLKVVLSIISGGSLGVWLPGPFWSRIVINL